MKAQAVRPARGDDTTVRKLGAALLLGLFVSAQAALPAAAETAPREVVLIGVVGRVTARPAERYAQVSLVDGGMTAFDNARVLVKRDRISILARSEERTLYAWANRYGGGGGIGVVVRSRDRRQRARTYSAIVNRIVIDGADGVLSR